MKEWTVKYVQNEFNGILSDPVCSQLQCTFTDEEVEPIEIPGENREESSVVETRGAIEVPDDDNGDKTNVGEKDFEVDEGHLREQGEKS